MNSPHRLFVLKIIAGKEVVGEASFCYNASALPTGAKGRQQCCSCRRKRSDVSSHEEGDERSMINYPKKNACFFRHTECEYFPCHATDRPEDFNCLFCYCPLYVLGERCGGNYSYTANGVKDCSQCLFPHKRSNYSAIVSRFPEIAEIARKKDGASP